MSGHQNSDYYAERALQERRMMEAANHPRAISAHAELAARYETLSAYPSFVLPAERSAAG